MLAGGQLTQGAGVGLGENQSGAHILLQQVIVHDSPLLYDHLLAFERAELVDPGGALAGKDRLVDDGVSGGEVIELLPIRGMDHPLKHIHLTQLQLASHLVPAAQLDLHIDPHHLGNRPGQLGVVAVRLSLIVDEFVGGVVQIAADPDRRIRLLAAGAPPQRGQRQPREHAVDAEPAGEASAASGSGQRCGNRHQPCLGAPARVGAG